MKASVLACRDERVNESMSCVSYIPLKYMYIMKTGYYYVDL